MKSQSLLQDEGGPLLDLEKLEMMPLADNPNRFGV